MPHWISVSGIVRVSPIQVVTMDRGYIVAGARLAGHTMARLVPLIADLIEKLTQKFGRAPI